MQENSDQFHNLNKKLHIMNIDCNRQTNPKIANL